MLNLHLQQINTLDAAITEIDREVDANLAPFRTGVELLTSIPGISTLSAQVILSEIGTNMSQFPTAGHIISWAGLCPRNDESAGKRRSTRLRKGAPWLKTTLVQCASSASRKKASYTQAQFHRLRARRSAKKAVCAVAASILAAAYHMLKDGTQYRDLGPDDSTAVQSSSRQIVCSSAWPTLALPLNSPYSDGRFFVRKPAPHPGGPRRSRCARQILGEPRQGIKNTIRQPEMSERESTPLELQGCPLQNLAGVAAMTR